MKQETIMKMHNGLHRVPLFDAAVLMPELSDILYDLGNIAIHSLSRYVIDVKVHMLMPGQWPSIPNWHFDMVPRDENGKQDFSKIVRDQMYLWVSGPPLTEFRHGPVEPQKWIPFTQIDTHRGVASTEHCWRLFIRACPLSILEPNPPEKWIRRHSQVYLDSSNFKW